MVADTTFTVPQAAKRVGTFKQAQRVQQPGAEQLGLDSL
jgi:hypothetical protein